MVPPIQPLADTEQSTTDGHPSNTGLFPNHASTTQCESSSATMPASSSSLEEPAFWNSSLNETSSSSVVPTSILTSLQQELSTLSSQLPNDSSLSSSSWHLDELLPRLLGDVVVGAVVTAAIAPSVTILDQAMVQSAAGTHTLLGSAQEATRRILQQPWTYLKSPTFLWMWTTYGVTYITANSLHTLANHCMTLNGQEHEEAPLPDSHANNHDHKPELSSVSSSTAAVWWASVVFLGTTAANSTAALAKDRAYARMFGSTSASTSTGFLPHTALALWLARDLTAIGSSFVLPPYVAQYLHDYSQQSQSTTTRTTTTPSETTLAVAQFVTPMAAQLVAGPLHFLGLDACNRPMPTISWANRWQALVQTGLSSFLLARMARILPSYGIGGVWNQQGRHAWNEWIDDMKTTRW